MVKNSKTKIEQDKQKILQELIKNGRQSTNNISNKMGFSRQKTWKYIKELEKEGKIWGYTAVTEQSKDNKKLYFALIKQKIPYLSNIDLIIKNIKNGNSEKLNIKLIGLYYTNGPYDCICIFEAKNVKDAKKYLGYIMNEYKELIVNVDLVENVFPMVHFTKVNPNLDELHDFSIKI